MNGIHAIVVPQLNVNDDTVRFVEWAVPHGTSVGIETPVSVVETSKAAAEVCAESSGVLYHLVAPGKKVHVGDELGLIGPSMDEIERFLADRTRSEPPPMSREEGGQPEVTVRARLLMEASGISELEMRARGVRGAIKEKDVRAYLSAREANGAARERPVLPESIRLRVDELGPLSEHEAAVADVLSVSRQSLLLTSASRDIRLSSINAFIRRSQESGCMLTLLHCIIGAASRALKKFPRLRSIYYSRSVYCYRSCDIGFVVRSLDGRLFTPVVREADTLPVEEIARRSTALAMKANRGSLREEDSAGGCFTISHIAEPPLLSFQALPNQYQSAILAVAGERASVELLDGKCREIRLCTLTLSYDHTLCDGMYAADFLHTLDDELNRLSHEPIQ
ncbi:MAG: 2-oxo acid dehydrogenase subunit E2 [Acidobacteriota bacterium]